MLQIICWLLPASRLKNWLLRRFGHDVHPLAHVGPNLVVGVSRAELGEYCRIGPFNVFRGLRLLRVSRYAMVESWCWISAHPIYRTVDANAGTLFVGTAARLGSRAYIDCSGIVVLRAFCILGGNRCFVQTHELDVASDSQTVGRVTVGHHSMVGSSAVLLKGAFVPDRSILAANSTMLRTSTGESPRPGLYGGSPAVWKREVAGDWFTRDTYYSSGYLVDEDLALSPEDVQFDDSEVTVDQAGQAELAKSTDGASILFRNDDFMSRRTS